MPFSHSTIDAVRRRISEVLDKHEGQNRTVRRVLVCLFAAGLLLLVFGGLFASWWPVLFGSLLEGAIVYPIRQLTVLRRQSVSLETVLALLPLVEDEAAQRVLIQMIERLTPEV